MKQLLFFIAIMTFLLPIKGQYKISYNLEYVKDSLNSDAVTNESFFLFNKENTSYFISKNLIKFYEFLNNAGNSKEPKSLITSAISAPGTNFRYFTYKNLLTDSIYLAHIFIKEKFKYSEKMNLSWRITNDTLTINKMLCKKALINYGNRNFTAWFNEDIPISDGPYKFYGLPGLIIKLEDEQKHYSFLLESLEKWEGDIADIFSDWDTYHVITKRDYNKILKNERNTLGELEQVTNLSPETKRRVLLSKKRNNNPIERFTE